MTKTIEAVSFKAYDQTYTVPLTCPECGADLTKPGAVRLSTDGWYSYVGRIDKGGQLLWDGRHPDLSDFSEFDCYSCSDCGHDGLGDISQLPEVQEDLPIEPTTVWMIVRENAFERYPDVWVFATQAGLDAKVKELGFEDAEAMENSSEDDCENTYSVLTPTVL